MATLNDLIAIADNINQNVATVETNLLNETAEIAKAIADLKALGTIPDAIIQQLADSNARLGVVAGNIANLVTPATPQ